MAHNFYGLRAILCSTLLSLRLSLPQTTLAIPCVTNRQQTNVNQTFLDFSKVFRAFCAAALPLERIRYSLHPGVVLRILMLEHELIHPWKDILHRRHRMHLTTLNDCFGNPCQTQDRSESSVSYSGPLAALDKSAATLRIQCPQHVVLLRPDSVFQGLPQAGRAPWPTIQGTVELNLPKTRKIQGIEVKCPSSDFEAFS